MGRAGREAVGGSAEVQVVTANDAAVQALTEVLASRWGLSRRTNQLLVVLVVASGVETLRHPLALLVTLACGFAIVRSAVRHELVGAVLLPYVAALVDAFGLGCAEALSTGAPGRRRSESPVAWVLAAWRANIESRVGNHECAFGGHELGCVHRPFRASAAADNWPAPFAGWIASLHTAELVT